jgi:hypothetical protein
MNKNLPAGKICGNEGTKMMMMMRQKKNCVIRVTRPTLFFPADPTTFFFSFTKKKKKKKKKKKNPVGQNGEFRRYVAACVHVPDNTRLIVTYSEEYSLADVFREIHKLACLGQFSPDSKN